jgi:hypothetical protein
VGNIASEKDECTLCQKCKNRKDGVKSAEVFFITMAHGSAEKIDGHVGGLLPHPCGPKILFLMSLKINGSRYC